MENEYSINLLNEKHVKILKLWPTLNSKYLVSINLLYPTSIGITANTINTFIKHKNHYTMKEWLMLNKHEVLNDK